MKGLSWIVWSVVTFVVLAGCVRAGEEQSTRQYRNSFSQPRGPAPESVLVEGAPQQDGLTDIQDFELQVTTEKEAEEPPAVFPGGDQLLLPGSDRKIIKNATLRLEVDNVFSVLNQVTLLTSQYGGYVLNSRTWYEEERPYAVMTFAVPAEQFEETLEQLRRLGKVLDETTTGQDVTDEYVDLEARIRNLEATADRIRSFLDEARTVEEALQVNEQLRYVEEELERLKARRNALEQRTAFSTITVELQPVLAQVDQELPPWSPGKTFAQAWQTLMRVVQQAVDAAIWVSVLGSPLLLVLVPLWILGRRFLGQAQ
ncbi:MAG: DUF4349 domain-containing protein [Ardenticatenia bacterium]|nr:DUF4349 domain-containing protein [Ardenticatenia bacterium]